jgi:hypothetical protein
MSKCPDCKGSGKYVGSFVVEDCLKCKGKGNLAEETWEQLEEAIEGTQSDNVGAPPLKVGDFVYKYDENWGWYRTIVESIYASASGRKMVSLKTNDRFAAVSHVQYIDLSYNVSKQRWEHGT